MSITPVYLLIKTLDFPCYAGLPPLTIIAFELTDCFFPTLTTMKLPNSYTYRQSELPPMTDDIKSAIAEIQLSASTLIMQTRGHYYALTKLAEILADCLNTCEANLHNICIISDNNDDEPVQRAIGLTDLPALEKQLLVSTAVTSTVAIRVLAGLFDCDFEQAASHIRAIGQV